MARLELPGDHVSFGFGELVTHRGPGSLLARSEVGPACQLTSPFPWVRHGALGWQFPAPERSFKWDPLAVSLDSGSGRRNFYSIVW